MLYAQGKRVGHVLDHLVEVEVLLLEHSLLAVEHTHLQHLLHEEAQALGLVLHHSRQMLHHGLALGDTLVVHHLRRKRNAGDRRLELVGHIVDEVILNLRQSLRAEYRDYREDKGDEQHHGEDHTGNHEADRRVDVAVHIGEVQLDNSHLADRVVAEEYLGVGVLFSLVGIVGTTIDLATVLGRHGEMVANVDAIVHQLCLEVLVEQLEVDALLQRFV